MRKSTLVAIGFSAVILAPSTSIAGGNTDTKAECKALGGAVTKHYKQYGNYWCETKAMDRRCEKQLKVKSAFYNTVRKRCVRLSNDSSWQDLYDY
jgi:hypothetical protein